MKDLFFSIIIPTLNEENYLPKILFDLTKQNLKNFEVIIVDASSEDQAKKKTQKFSKLLPLEFYTVKKRNVSYQRNFGAQKTKGEYLLFLDADNRVSPTLTENLYRDILKTGESLFLPTLITDEPSPKNKLLFKLVNSAVKLSQSLDKPLSAGGSIFIARKLFFDLKGFKENLYTSEDHNLIQRARDLGIKATILKDVKVVFSLRRVKKEGEAAILYKYFLSSVYSLVNGEITDKIYAYEMGGGKYRKLKLKDKKRSFKEEIARLQKLYRKASAFLADSLP